MNSKKKLGIVGCGYLGGIIGDAVMAGLLPEYELVGVTSRSMTSAQMLAARTHCRPCRNIGELLALKPDYVVEAASPRAVTELAEPVLRGGADLILLSIGAFADTDFYEHIRAVALETGRKVHLASGAIGGFDVLRTAALMGPVTAGITTEKGPQSLEGTPVYREELARADGEAFRGNAREAIALLPTRVNVAVATSLATNGPDETSVCIRSILGMTGDDHCIEVVGEEVRATVDIYSKTSAIAGWSVVALLRNLVSPIVF